MKRIKSLLAVLAIVSMLFTVAFADGSAVSFANANYEIDGKTGDTVTFTVKSDADTDVYGGAYIQIAYDEATWNFTTKTLAADFGSGSISNRRGLLRITLNASQNVSVKSGQELATITATLKKDLTSDADFATAALKFNDNGKYTTDGKTKIAYDGAITVAKKAAQEDPTYTVTFKDGDTVVAEETATKDNGYKVTAPAANEKEGYTFDGWFNGEVKFDADAAVSADVTYTAKYTKINATEPTFAKNEVIGTVEIDGNEYTDIFKGEYSYTLNKYTKVTKVGVNVKSVATDVTKAFDKEVSIEGETTVAFKLALLGVDDTAKLETSALVEYADRY